MRKLDAMGQGKPARAAATDAGSRATSQAVAGSFQGKRETQALLNWRAFRERGCRGELDGQVSPGASPLPGPANLYRMEPVVSL